MKIKSLQHKEVIDKVVIWSNALLEEALSKKDILSLIQLYVLLEICKPCSQEGKIPFEKILNQKSPEDFIKASPSLCIEFFILIKKYRPDLYKKEISNIVDVYTSILEEIRNDQPNNSEIFFMMRMIHQLNDMNSTLKKTTVIHISEDSFLLQPKTIIEKHHGSIKLDLNNKLTTFKITLPNG